MGENECCRISEIEMSERKKKMKHRGREKNREGEGGLDRKMSGIMIMQH